MSKCSNEANYNRNTEGFCILTVYFDINWSSANITQLVLMTFKRNIFSFIKLFTISCAVFMSLLVVVNSKKYKPKYLNTLCHYYE